MKKSDKILRTVVNYTAISHTHILLSVWHMLMPLLCFHLKTQKMKVQRIL